MLILRLLFFQLLKRKTPVGETGAPYLPYGQIFTLFYIGLMLFNYFYVKLVCFYTIKPLYPLNFMVYFNI